MYVVILLGSLRRRRAAQASDCGAGCEDRRTVAAVMPQLFVIFRFCEAKCEAKPSKNICIGRVGSDLFSEV